ncbi:type II toxin-antitoxin system RelE/ParE family toxin [Taklimakanibacter lacteus]|uniref:type II toxin-antitoxin system RelE/ParE family toxin n=1 Tax=Taklimakanibacter lacteus TaxID=2268456 RepID=UPI000E670410
MKRPVQWSRAALDDLKEQIAYIAADNPAAALRVADRIRDTGTALGKMAVGRPGRMTGTYEKLVTRLPYVVAYAITMHGGSEVIPILRVIHTSRDWPANEWPDRSR